MPTRLRPCYDSWGPQKNIPGRLRKKRHNPYALAAIRRSSSTSPSQRQPSLILESPANLARSRRQSQSPAAPASSAPEPESSAKRTRHPAVTSAVPSLPDPDESKPGAGRTQGPRSFAHTPACCRLVVTNYCTPRATPQPSPDLGNSNSLCSCRILQQSLAALLCKMSVRGWNSSASPASWPSLSAAAISEDPVKPPSAEPLRLS